MSFKPTYLMIKHHKKTGLLYFCKTTKADPYQYRGSGVRWTNHLKIHGRDVETIWCRQFTDMGTLIYFATEFSIRNSIVTSVNWANLVIEDGITGWPPGSKHKKESVEKCRLNANGFKIGHVPHNKGKPASLDHLKKQKAGITKYRQQNPNWGESFFMAAKDAEPKRIAAIKARMTGSNNWNYDPTVYVFINKQTHDKVSMTRNEFIKAYKCPAQNVHSLIKGKRKSVLGWMLHR